MSHACCKPTLRAAARFPPAWGQPSPALHSRARTSLPHRRARRDVASTSIFPRQENKTEETVKLHLYASSTGTERERRGAIANVLAEDGSNDELAHGNRLREGPQDLWELPCASSPPTCSSATKQKKIKRSEGGAGVRGHAIAHLPPAKCPPCISAAFPGSAWPH